MENKEPKMITTHLQKKETSLTCLDEILKTVKAAEDIDEDGREHLKLFAEALLRKLNKVEAPKNEPVPTEKTANNKENEKEQKNEKEHNKKNDHPKADDFQNVYRRVSRQRPQKMDALYAEFGLEDPLDFDNLPDGFESRVRELDLP